MKNKVAIIDTGSGNILSVGHAFKYCGGDIIITKNPDKIAQADYLVLPGVGTFG